MSNPSSALTDVLVRESAPAKKDGNNPDDWEYFDDKKLKQFAESIAPKRVRDMENLTKVEIPENVTPEKWIGFLEKQPAGTQTAWANMLSKLVVDPNPDSFNNEPLARKYGLRADAILAQLGVPYSGPKTPFEGTVSGVHPIEPEQQHTPGRSAPRPRMQKPADIPHRDWLKQLGMSEEEIDAMRAGLDREANPARNLEQNTPQTEPLRTHAR